LISNFFSNEIFHANIRMKKKKPICSISALKYFNFLSHVASLGIRLYTLDKYLTRNFFLIPALAGAKPSLGAVTKQACDAKNLGELTKKFETPAKIENDSEVSFYCTTDDCNVAEEITKVIKEDVAKTLEAMKAVGNVKAGAAQTSVAVATIAFSMAMARLAL